MNRRVMIAWMQNRDTGNVGNNKRKIYGQMTFPRELTLRGKRVYQNPVGEIEKYYGTKIIYEGLEISGERHFTSLSYDARRSVFKIDRSRSGVVNDIVNYREFEVLTVNGKLKIRILLDRYSVEIFIFFCRPFYPRRLP